MEDQDRYTCTAKNAFGHQDKTIVLLVTGLVSPVLGHVSPEEQLIQGEELRLSCVVVLGTPKPTLRWYKDGVPLRSSAYVTGSAENFFSNKDYRSIVITVIMLYGYSIRVVMI
ncbi:unnamed protein product [Gongylonema pulchrum]|uniref:Ig-like domain-containing protein n=1 Tax=Gongylonema pulchrum TaxID=637853 RepID=A0A183D7S3_9BILA|nr:unnamed protein product [Gongylonema pulchrum]